MSRSTKAITMSITAIVCWVAQVGPMSVDGLGLFGGGACVGAD